MRRRRPGLAALPSRAPGIGRGRRHSPARPAELAARSRGSPGRPKAPEPLRQPGGASRSLSRSRRGDRSARLSRPAPCCPPPARTAPGRVCRPQPPAGTEPPGPAPPEPPVSRPVPGARGYPVAPVPLPFRSLSPPPAAPPLRRPLSQPLCVRARGCKWRPAGTRQRRHRAAPGGSGHCGAPRPPHRHPPAPSHQHKGHSPAGSCGRCRRAGGERAGGGCGIPGPASGLAVPAGAAPLLPQPCEPERHRNKRYLLTWALDRDARGLGTQLKGQRSDRGRSPAPAPLPVPHTHIAAPSRCPAHTGLCCCHLCVCSQREGAT
ncbi:uncharacterized protein LOC141731334 [Zonotrichia albicollis]|uniref:uncharacterized protein LOC141731334 n=1 Tax=Zonotrichia albicollis TaxID=44394 RepID=UPI003D80B1DD